MDSREQRRPPQAVAVLSPDVAQQIAAGEVIERPASVVRELIDNAVDAGATTIDIAWESGGASLIRVADDGVGMSRSDLELCTLPHATSKIRTLEDLEASRSLGFRGEALSSIGAVARLAISSQRRDDAEGSRVEVAFGGAPRVSAAALAPGTIVEVRDLFAQMPARRRFLGRAQGESAAIGAVVRDKAMAAPETTFRFGSVGRETVVLPAAPLVDRVAEVLSRAVQRGALHEVTGSGEGFAVHAIIAEPTIVRRDRRSIQIFVNGRRVWEYRFIQAVEHAYADVLHGGLYPVAAVYLEINPELVDFNIHPAKREVRVRRAGDVHHRIVELLRGFLQQYARRAATVQPSFFAEGRPPASAPDALTPGRRGPAAPEREAWAASRGGSGSAAGDHRSSHGQGRTPWGPRATVASAGAGPRPGEGFAPSVRAVPDAVAEGGSTLRYVGTLFGTYLVVERDDRLFLIDQHAGHERLVYDRLRADRTVQRLLVPELFDVTEDQDRAIEDHRDEYRILGVELERRGKLRWALVALPTSWKDAAEAVIETITELGGLQDALDRQFIAELACKAAVKAGDYLDGLSAHALAERLLALPEPRCPHGRPLWIEMDREQLDRLIGRR